MYRDGQGQTLLIIRMSHSGLCMHSTSVKLCKGEYILRYSRSNPKN